MAERSAGILLFRRTPEIEVFLGHMGGPFWERKDAGAWSVPKGEIQPGERPLDAALREFAEEVGSPPPAIDYEELGVFRYSSGKTVTLFAGEADFDPGPVSSNLFTIEWPPRSGRMRSFPELDDARWVPATKAAPRLVTGQRPAIAALLARVG
jgi:predicted NUDIX family NTP pyrophosphohydrolase